MSLLDGVELRPNRCLADLPIHCLRVDTSATLNHVAAELKRQPQCPGVLIYADAGLEAFRPVRPAPVIPDPAGF